MNHFLLKVESMEVVRFSVASIPLLKAEGIPGDSKINKPFWRNGDTNVSFPYSFTRPLSHYNFHYAI